jgi:hypothetical protein
VPYRPCPHIEKKLLRHTQTKDPTFSYQNFGDRV